MLKRIQDNFLTDADSVAAFLEQASKEAPKQHNEGEAVKRYVYSFTPETLTEHKAPSHSKPNHEKGTEPQVNATMSRVMLSSTPPRNRLRRSKIFEKSVSTDRYRESRLSARKSSRTP